MGRHIGGLDNVGGWEAQGLLSQVNGDSMRVISGNRGGEGEEGLSLVDNPQVHRGDCRLE